MTTYQLSFSSNFYEFISKIKRYSTFNATKRNKILKKNSQRATIHSCVHVACLAEKQQKSIILSLVLPDQGLNPRSITFKASKLDAVYLTLDSMPFPKIKKLQNPFCPSSSSFLMLKTVDFYLSYRKFYNLQFNHTGSIRIHVQS